MNAWLRWLLLVVAIAACVAIGFAAYTLAGISWDAVVSYTSPYVGEPLPQAAAAVNGTPHPQERIVVVIIDGLRLDASRRMATLNKLREYGSDLELTAPQPSLSYPNWTTVLTGAPPYVSGVVTNWHEGPAPVETLFDTARAARTDTVFVGPQDFEELYGVAEKTSASFMREWSGAYLSGTYVDETLRLAGESSPTAGPRLIVLHLPDIDEAGHDFGGESAEYAETVEKVDADLGRLVEEMQDGATSFVVVTDHGHIATGGHGGWESEVVKVPGVFAGNGIRLGTGTGRLQDVAPTIAVLAGVGTPRWSAGRVLQVLDADVYADGIAAAEEQRASFEAAYIGIVSPPGGGPAATVAEAEQLRLAFDRRERLVFGFLGAAVCVTLLGLIGIASWRALVAALCGTAGYYAVYNLLFFVVHGYRWSLSSFNSEDLIDSWMNLRLAEAALSGLVAVAVAAAVYPLLRRQPKPPRDIYLPGWLVLGPTTVLTILATLGLQVAWFVWWWGVEPTWRLPDLMWGFKYDLDLIQATALGFVAVATPLVSYLVGRYHPKVRPSAPEE
jgi:hypothetical protein